MGWEQLSAIAQSARIDAALEAKEPPVACPHDGSILDVRPDGVRNCPMGNYDWNGGPKLI